LEVNSRTIRKALLHWRAHLRPKSLAKKFATAEPPPRDDRTQGESAHEGRQHRTRRELCGAEDQDQLAQPDDLVDQRGRSGEEKQREDYRQRPAEVSRDQRELRL